MEDYPQQELSLTGKKRSREFFMNWLHRRRLPLDIEPKNKDEEDDDELDFLEPEQSQKPESKRSGLVN
ncbi:MAG: hypothetical protein ACREGC_01135, partial [Minisyncoccia bacterium]